MFKKFIKTRDPDSSASYMLYRSQLNDKAMKAKNNHYINTLSDEKLRPEKLGKQLNDLLHPREDLVVTDSTINNTTYNGGAVADKINDYYVKPVTNHSIISSQFHSHNLKT